MDAVTMKKKPTPSPGIYLVGLGPGDPLLLTRHAWQLLGSVTEVYLRTSQHPVISQLPATLKIESFDYLYEQGENFEEVYNQIVERVLELGRRPQGVVYAVPGHPFVAEATVPEIAKRARQEGLPVHVIEGISFLSVIYTILGIDPFPAMLVLDALTLGSSYTPTFPPDTPAIIAQIHSTAVASSVKLTLSEVYPDDHKVTLVHAAGTPQVIVEDLPLHLIDQSPHIGLLTALYLPPLGPGVSFESFQELIAHLRSPDGCPWDREQDHQTLRPHLLEEAYEVLSALDQNDPEGLREELGDLLLQIVLHAQIAVEYGEFTMADVIKGIHHKIVRRHPHVFGDQEIADAEGVVRNWERLKAGEREANEKSQKRLMEGVPPGLPALMQAETYQKRAARVGFDWPDIEGVIAKVCEELEEVKAAPEDERGSEIGDLLFSLVNLARHYDVDAESVLREANVRFRERFEYIEKAAQEQGKPLSDLTLDEMERLWQEAKKGG
jgi:tetrapyrrole methylase family protein / MazG family protein